MQLYYFLAVILSLSFASLPPATEDPAAAIERLREAAMFTGLVVVAWWGLCYLSVRLVAGLVDQGEVSCDLGIDWFDRHTECFRWFSLGLVLLCLGGFGLGRDLQIMPVLRHSLAAQSMVLLLPAWAMMLGLWTAEYWFGVRMGLARRGLGEAARWLWASLRCTVGWLVVPILAVLGGLDILSLSPLAPAVPGWLLWCLLGLLTVFGVPLVVRRIFPTRPLHPETKQWIHSVLRSAGLRHCRVVMWDTGGRTHNAMIAGLLGRFRVLMVSDRLVDELPREQLAMVILHEAAHAKRFHVPLRIASLVPVWVAGGALQEWLAGAMLPSSVAEWSATYGAIASLAGTVLVLRWVSHYSEYDADRAACRMAPRVAQRCESVPAASDQAAGALAAALRRVTGASQTTLRATWLHPSISSRIEAVAAAKSALPAGDLFGGA